MSSCASFEGTEGSKRSTKKNRTNIHDKTHALRMKVITTNALQKSSPEKNLASQCFGGLPPRFTIGTLNFKMNLHPMHLRECRLTGREEGTPPPPKKGKTTP